MNKLLTFLLLLVLAITIDAQAISPEEKKIAQKEYPTDTLYKIWLDYRKDEQSLSKFYDSLPEKHIIELSEKNPKELTVTYFAKGSRNTEYIMQSGGPDFFGLRFKQISNSHYYFCIQKVPSDAWFNYGFNEFKRTKLSNDSDMVQSSMEHIYDGALIGHDAPLSSHIQVSQNVPKGKLREVTLSSKKMGEKRKFIVYIPANYSSKAIYDLVIQLDGQNYSSNPNREAKWQGWTPMPTILDNLIHNKKIPPTIAIMVLNQGNRTQDMLSDKFSDFIGLEVVSWAKKNFNIVSSSKVIISGPSRAGFAAANTAFIHSDVISGVLAQSGSFYYTLNDKKNWPIYPEFEGKLLTDYKRSSKLSIRFYLDVGLYDLGLARVGVNRQLKDILEIKGYELNYNEYKGGHSHLNWRHSLPDGLMYLLNDIKKIGIQERGR